MKILERFIAVANSALQPLGLSLNKLSDSKGFALHEYKKRDGSFDYEQYRAVQRRGNLEKLQNVWVDQTNINFLADYIKTKVGAVNFGICHGTRRGLEQKWFSEALGCKVTVVAVVNMFAVSPGKYYALSPIAMGSARTSGGNGM